MLKVVKWVGLSILSGLILCWLFVYLVASGINETTTYTENDLYNYHTLTEKEIEKAPRISGDYHFESHPGDGYAPSNTIIFRGASDVEPLRAYLKNLGYINQRNDTNEAEVWVKPEQANSDLFYLYLNRATGEAKLTKEIRN